MSDDKVSEAASAAGGAAPGLLCRCSTCGREERAGESPLRDGWPKCCGYTMTLIDTQRFIASVSEHVEKAAGFAFMFENGSYEGTADVTRKRLRGRDG